MLSHRIRGWVVAFEEVYFLHEAYILYLVTKFEQSFSILVEVMAILMKSKMSNSVRWHFGHMIQFRMLFGTNVQN